MKNWSEAPLKPTENPQFIKDHVQIMGEQVVRITRQFATHNHEADTLDGEIIDQNSLPESPISAHIEGLNRAKRLFDELPEKYGIAHAGFSPFVGETDGKISEIMVSDFIDAEPAVDPKKTPIPAEQLGAAKVLLENLTGYVRDKHANDEEMLSDIFRYEQSMYQPGEDALILVDADPLSEREFGAKLAYDKLQEWAGFVLQPDEYKVWDAEMSQMADESMQIIFDEDF